METTKQYVDMMTAGLQKKLMLLDNIIEVNRQLEKLMAQPLELEVFRELMDEKDGYVQQINQLDSGFQSVFDKVKETLDSNRTQYREQILMMQQLIRQLTDRTVQIEECEARLRLMIEGQFSRMHRENQAAKKGMNVAQSYYKSMSGMTVVDAQFMDKKN